MAKKIEEFEIISTEKFERDLKYYAGKKKYFHITKDVKLSPNSCRRVIW